VSPLVVVACIKRVELRAGVDLLTGAVIPDAASAGPSPADEAALEWSLRIAEASGGAVVVVSAGGPECDVMLRGAIAAGATRAVRVPLGPVASDVPSQVVARALTRAVAAAADAAGVVVCCGDASVDRGSGSVPAFLAGKLAIAQALGLVGVSLAAWESGEAACLDVERRLDRGRRERLRLRPPFVISVEAGTARLRRASLQRSLASRDAVVEVLPAEVAPAHSPVELVGVEAYRPRTRVVPPPPPGLGARGRIAVLTGALQERRAARTLVLDAEAGADELLSALAEWDELPEGVLAGSPDAGGHSDAEPEPEHTEVS